MEEINDSTMRKFNLKKSTCMQRIVTCFVLVWAAFVFRPAIADAQIRAGIGYLKMIPGARESGLSGTLTSALDYTHSFHANPAATGFLREWQWSATYTNWISDIYNASFIYGRSIRTPWSRWTRVAVGVNYLGIPEFNNLDQQGQSVSGNDLLVTTSLGQPLHFLSEWLSLGANAKYFRSTMGEYTANGFMFDMGLLARTPRMPFLFSGNGWLDYMILSAGISANNLGPDLTYISEKTPLPRTLRGGVAVNVGAHHGFQVSVGTDYRTVRDADGFFTLGSEISWRQLISVRGGMSWEENNLIGDASFGAGIRFDDILMHTLFPGQNVFPGRNDAIKLDLAGMEQQVFFDSPYHGAVVHQPIGPEYFRFLYPEYAQIMHIDTVRLSWEASREPDLYDDLQYWLLVDPDSTQLANGVEAALTKYENLFGFLAAEPYFLHRPVLATSHLIDERMWGDYYWAVLAVDTDQHVRPAEMDGRRISKFHVTQPDPRVIALNFDPQPFITNDDYQGQLMVTIKNFGDREAINFTLNAFDSLASSSESARLADAENSKFSFWKQELPVIPPDSTAVIQFEWRTDRNGLHDIQTELVRNDWQMERAHTYRTELHSIPKGSFRTDEIVLAQTQTIITYDLPYLGKIFFDSQSNQVRDEYIHHWEIQPPLDIFAERLRMDSTITITLQGTADSSAGEFDLALAQRRAAAVRDTLLTLGVKKEQMRLKPGVLFPRRRRPRGAEDARRVFEDRRYVEISTDQKYEEYLFGPLHTKYNEKKNLPVGFLSDIHGALPIKQAAVLMEAGNDTFAIDISDSFQMADLNRSIQWSLDLVGENQENRWLDTDITYSLALTDSLGRQFRVPPKQTYLNTKLAGHERRYFVLAQFGKRRAYYDFYWENLINLVPYLVVNPDVKLRFIGHGCAIGSAALNDTLSLGRAFDFQNQFLKDVNLRYPHLTDEQKTRLINTQLLPPEGMGESTPLSFKFHDGTEVVLGNNDKPVGRQLNRRVMIRLFTPADAARKSGDEVYVDKK